MSSRLARVIPALVLVAAMGTGCSSGSSTSVAPTPVPGPNFSFAFPGIGTSLASPGTSNKLVFNDVGSWGYRCIAHSSSGMIGTVVVDAASTNDSQTVAVGAPGPNPGNLNFVPQSVTIKPGGYVRWANVSNMTNHTVTRP